MEIVGDGQPLVQRVRQLVFQLPRPLLPALGVVEPGAPVRDIGPRPRRRDPHHQRVDVAVVVKIMQNSSPLNYSVRHSWQCCILDFQMTSFLKHRGIVILLSTALKRSDSFVCKINNKLRLSVKMYKHCSQINRRLKCPRVFKKDCKEHFPI